MCMPVDLATGRRRMKDAAQGKLVDMHSDTGAIDYYNRALEIDIKNSGHDCRTTYLVQI